MSANVALGVVIGGAVGASFGKALSDSSAKIDVFKQKSEKARGFHNLIGDTIRLRDEMGKTADKSGAAFGKLLKAHESNIQKLKAHGFAVHQLDKDYARLGRTVKGLELRQRGHEKIGAGVEAVKNNWQVGAAAAASIAAPVMVSANYQAIIRDIAIKGGIARTGQETAMSESIRKDAADSGIDRNELAQAVNTLVAGGMAVEEAVAQARSVARFAVSQNSDSTDTAKLVLALRQAGITDPAAMEKALGKIAVAGDLGSFEAKDMAKHFGNLMPQMTAFGLAGEHATMALANMLQTQMKAAGSADEAANNLANLLGKIVSDDSKKKFADKGIDLQGSMQAAIAKGYDPVSAFIGLIQESIKQGDPGKAQEMAALQERIAKAQDPAAAQKMLDGYLEMAGLSEFISDRQARQAALAAIQNQQLHRDNLKKIQDADGQAKIEKDLADRREASQQRWREVGRAMDEAMARLGDAIRPLTDAAATGLKALGDAVSWTAEKAPVLVAGLLALGAAMAGVGVAKGLGKMAGGALDVGRGMWNVWRGGKLPQVPGSGKGGLAGKLADVLGGAGGGVQPVFVTNWPGGGIDLPGGQRGKNGPLTPKDKLGRATHIGKATTAAEGAASAGRAGVMARLGTAAAGVVGAGKAAMAAPTLGAVAAGGAGTLAAGGALVAGAGLGGYAIGSVINAGINKAMSAATGKETSLGGWIYDKLHPEKPDSAPVAKAPAPSPSGGGTPTKATPVSQPLTFSPTIHVTVQGDVKDPRQLANELMPHLRRMFEQFQSQSARGAMFDPAHA